MKWKHGIINRPFVKDHVGKRGQGSQNSGPAPTRIPNFIPLNSILLPFPKYKLYRISSWQSGLIWILTRKPTGFDISAVSLDKWYFFFCIWLFISQSKIISSVSAQARQIRWYVGELWRVRGTVEVGIFQILLFAVPTQCPGVPSVSHHLFPCAPVLVAMDGIKIFFLYQKENKDPPPHYHSSLWNVEQETTGHSHKLLMEGENGLTSHS